MMTTNIAKHAALPREHASETSTRRGSLGDIVRQVLIVVATISTLVVNYLANALPINGLGTGEISDAFNIYFVPAGYVFSIWGLIYLGVVGYTVYQALPAQRTNPLLRAIGPLYLLSAVANIGWIFLWHYQQFVLTIPVMLILLASLIAIYIRLDRGRGSLTQAGRWLVGVPFRIYLGWITVATVANVTSTLDWVNWGGWGIGELVWFWIMLGVATLVGAGFAWLRRDIAYVAVLVWAFAGIAVEHSGVQGVVWASIGAAIVLAVILAAAWLVRGRQAGA